MAHWYVDSTVAAGNGADPSSPVISVLSIALAAGDYMWVRRTHDETIANSATPGQFHFPNAQEARIAHVIGWPNSGDPFYEQRPSAGRTPWDGDTAATVQATSFGLNLPTLACSASGSTGIMFGLGTIMANFYINNLQAATAFALRPLADSDGVFARGYITNVMFTRQSGMYQGITTGLAIPAGKITLACSQTGITASFIPAERFRNVAHLVIHSLSVCQSGGIFESAPASGKRFGVVENWSSSISFLGIDTNYTESCIPQDCVIDRVIGVEPIDSRIIGHSNNQQYNPIVVNDYFGRGPGILAAPEHIRGMLATSADAMFGTNRAWRWDVFSVAATDQNYLAGTNAQPFMRKFFSVTSGTTVTIALPVYIGSSEVCSVGNHNFRFHLLAKRCMPRVNVDSGILVGSYTPWTGNLIAGGSAWLFTSSWVPGETGVVPFDAWFSGVTQATSGLGRIGYALFGEPYTL